jgi:PIN domain nuclease of toxin-antitoxin system
VILLDTHALAWLDAGSPRLGTRSRRLADQALRENRLAISAISFWEIGMLLAKGRLELRLDQAQWRADLLRAGLLELPITGAIGLQAAALDDFHGDPADRLIVATALASTARLITADERILDWKKSLQCQDARK